MSIDQRYCEEILDESGRLRDFSLRYPANFNFGYDVVDVLAKEASEKTALVWCNMRQEEHRFSFEEIRAFSNQMAHVFRKAGIGRGDRVMVVLKRHYEYWFAAIALHKLGAVLIPATHMLTEEDWIYRIKVSGAKAMICTPDNQVPEKLRAALKKSGCTAKLWCVKEDREGFENLTRAMEGESTELYRVETLA